MTISSPSLLKQAIKSLSKEWQTDANAWRDVIHGLYRDKVFTESDLVWYYAENIPVISAICFDLLQEIKNGYQKNDNRKKAF